MWFQSIEAKDIQLTPTTDPAAVFEDREPSEQRQWPWNVIKGCNPDRQSVFGARTWLVEVTARAKVAFARLVLTVVSTCQKADTMS